MGADDINAGCINTPWWETRKITEWGYSTPIPLDEQMLKQLGKPKISVALRRLRGCEREKIVFVAKCSWFSNDPGEQEIQCKTLDELEREAKRILDDVVIARSAIKWEDWLEIRVSGSVEREEERKTRRSILSASMSSELSVSVKHLKRARLPDGRDMVLENGWSMKPFPKPKKAGVEEKNDRGMISFRRTEDEYAYLPATPENIAALDGVATMIESAATKLKSVLSQNAIKATLSNVKALPFRG